MTNEEAQVPADDRAPEPDDELPVPPAEWAITEEPPPDDLADGHAPDDDGVAL